MMTPRKVISICILILGVLTFVVGGVHFVMMDHLNRMISHQVNEGGQVLVLESFAVNHIASGVFLLLLGAIVSYSSVAGLRSGKKWGRIITLL